MGKMRHWKQHWDPDADLVFAKRLRLGIKGHEVVNAGDPVTPEIVKALGPSAKARLRRWWEAKFLELADWKAPEDIRRARRGRDPRLLRMQKPELEPTGRGWYAVRGPDGKSEKVRGLNKAKARLDELWQSGPADPDLSVDGARLRDELLTETMAAPGLVVEESPPRDEPLPARE